MDSAELAKLFAYFGVLPTVILIGASKLLPLLTGARSDLAESSARVGMLEQLQARIEKLEQQQKENESALDTERDARRQAEDKVSKLSRRVATLEGQLQAAGITPSPIF